MKISFNLMRPGAEISGVRVIVTHKGKTYRQAVGISVDAKKWSQSRQKSGNTTKDDALKFIRIGLEYALNDFCGENEIKEALSHVYEGKWHEKGRIEHKTGIPTLKEYMEEWANRDSGAARQKLLTFRTIFRYGNPDWEDINEKWVEEFSRYFNSKKYSRNYFGTTISRLKAVLHEGRKLGYHKSDFWREIHRETTETTEIALTTEECEKIIALDEELTEGERRARDLFALGYKTGARYSDISRLTSENIKGDRIVFVQQKTSQEVRLPVSPLVLEVFGRNGGKAPQLCSQYYNRLLKSVARKAGLDDLVEVVKSKGAGHSHELLPKWKLVSSHTARRSCVTALHLSGMAARDVMLISGHHSYSAFEKYIRVTNEESLKRLAENEFFK